MHSSAKYNYLLSIYHQWRFTVKHWSVPLRRSSFVFSVNHIWNWKNLARISISEDIYFNPWSRISNANKPNTARIYNSIHWIFMCSVYLCVNHSRTRFPLFTFLSLSFACLTIYVQLINIAKQPLCQILGWKAFTVRCINDACRKWVWMIFFTISIDQLVSGVSIETQSEHPRTFMNEY